jgi:hypothetical protein
MKRRILESGTNGGEGKHHPDNHHDNSRSPPDDTALHGSTLLDRAPRLLCSSRLPADMVLAQTAEVCSTNTPAALAV